MSYNSAFDAEMRKYQLEKVTTNVATSLTPRQLHTPIEQIDNVKKLNRRKTDQINKKKPPIFLRRWFITLMIMVFSTVYFIQAGYVQAVRNINENVKASTGIDILSVETYKQLAKPPEENANSQPQTITEQIEATTRAKSDTEIQTRNYSVNTEALGEDLTSIQREAEKLDAMAREFDQQFRQNR